MPTSANTPATAHSIDGSVVRGTPTRLASFYAREKLRKAAKESRTKSKWTKKKVKRSSQVASNGRSRSNASTVRTNVAASLSGDDSFAQSMELNDEAVLHAPPPSPAMSVEAENYIAADVHVNVRFI